MEILHVNTQQVLASNVRFARSFRDRLIGLMFIKEMKGFDGLILEPCRSVHNCFVKFPIDLLFVDKSYKIVGIVREFKPWRFSKIYWRAHKVIELKLGAIPDVVKVGDQIEVKNV